MHQHEKFKDGTPRTPDPVTYITNETRFQVDVLTRVKAALEEKRDNLMTTRNEATEINGDLLHRINGALQPTMPRVQSFTNRDVLITEYDRPRLSALAGDLADHPLVPESFWSELQACANITYDVIPVEHYNLTPDERRAGKPDMVPLFGAALRARGKATAALAVEQIHQQSPAHVTARVQLRKTV